jgi:hypothetical protein
MNSIIGVSLTEYYSDKGLLNTYIFEEIHYVVTSFIINE